MDNIEVVVNEEVTKVTIDDKNNVNIEISEEKVEVIEIGIPGLPGKDGNGFTYVHEQSFPSSIWNIKHDLNRYPNVTIVDSSDNVVFGDIEYLSNSELEVVFSSQFSGKAYLN